MIISVASGKGGTGKTTISTNLALALQEQEQVSLLDCDVEEPNAHIFIQPEINFEETAYTFVPKIDQDRCDGCGKCADICRFNAITVIGQEVMVFPELCHSCKGCQLVCPERAIMADKRELGQISGGKSRSLDFIQGCSRIGEAMSPPLIDQVLAKNNYEGLTIIDAPPGTSCPVISSIKGSNFVILVTEPTPFGLHDLILAVETVKVLGIPCGIVINRANLGFDKVHKYAEEENIPILLEIPFDQKIAEIYSTGKMLIDEMPEWKERFNEVYVKIKNIIDQKEVLQ